MEYKNGIRSHARIFYNYRGRWKVNIFCILRFFLYLQIWNVYILLLEIVIDVTLYYRIILMHLLASL